MSIFFESKPLVPLGTKQLPLLINLSKAKEQSAFVRNDF